MPKKEKLKTYIDAYTGGIVKATKPYNNRVMVGIPVTGLVRYEWVLGRYGQIIPCNWSQADGVASFQPWSPLGYTVADARNIIATSAVRDKFEWLFFIDHDVILPPQTTIAWNDYLLKNEIPVFGGLYFTKSKPSEPLVYRGRGTSYYNGWKMGDKVWVDGMGMGNTVISVSILKAMVEDVETYDIEVAPRQWMKVKRFFESPANILFDPEKQTWAGNSGTEDLFWCTKVIEGDYLAKAGWKKVAKKKYPFLIDTRIFCKHIDIEGIQYPNNGEEKEFEPKRKK